MGQNAGQSASGSGPHVRDQSITVSRIIQRYERWQAHLKDRENGRLDLYERYRAQRWLAYERNELILASCLRIAGEMEGFTELSKSTICRPIDEPSKQRQVRTEERVIDRHGVAARFLRLAFRINMEQLKLVDEQEPRRPDELSEEELQQEVCEAAADAAEIAAARQRAAEEVAARFGDDVAAQPPVGRSAPAAEHDAALTESADFERVGWDKAAPAANGPPSPSTELPDAVAERRALTATSPLSPEPRTLNPPLHNLHNEKPPQIAASATQPCTCTLEVRLEKNSPPCITVPVPLAGDPQSAASDGYALARELPRPSPSAAPLTDRRPIRSGRTSGD